MKNRFLAVAVLVTMIVMAACKPQPVTPPIVNPGDQQDLPYFQSFEKSFGTYSTYNVLGDQVWVIDYETAKMAGAEKVDDVYVNYENEDWLISSPVSISDVDKAKVVITYIGCYFNNINHDITIHVSEDYEAGKAPSTATWTKLTANFENSYSWDIFNTLEVSLNLYVGKNITIAVKYISDDVKAGTIEVKSISVEEGQAGGGGGDDENAGDLQQLPYTQSFTSSFGTYNTYDVSGDQYWIIDFKTAKMTGYDMGTSTNYANEDWLISSPVDLKNVSEAKMVMTYIARYFSNLNNDITVQVSSDYVYGDDPSNATWTHVPASLVSGADWTTFATTELNLTQFAGKEIYVAVKYLSSEYKAGTIEVQSISIEEGAPEDGGGNDFGDHLFVETFASGQGDFTIDNVMMAEALTYVWNYASNYQCMKASAYKDNTNHESESWLVSPAIDLSDVRDAWITFEHAYKYTSNAAEDLTLWVSTDYNGGSVNDATWTQVEIANYPTGNDWSFVSSNEIDISNFTGNSNVRVAFKYMSSNTQGATWEVKNVIIDGQ